MILLTYLLFIVMQYPTQSIAMDMFFVKDYLQFNNIRICVFLSCGNTTDRIKNRIDIQHDDDLWMSWWDISDESEVNRLNYTNIFARLASPIGVVIDLECANAMETFAEISNRKMFHYERFWLVFGRGWQQGYDALHNQFINIDAEISLVVPTNESDGYQIFEVFNPSFVRGGKLNITRIADWDSTNGFQTLNSQTKIERRHDLQQLWFQTATAIPHLPINKTFIGHLDSDEFPFLDSGDKNDYRLLKLVGEMFNFKILVRRADVWGILRPNGTWKGVIGMLSRDEIDFAVPSFRWANERYSAFDHTTHTYQIQYVFIFLHPKSVDTSGIYLSPFSRSVWSLIALLSIAIACAIRKMFCVEYAHLHQNGSECTYSNSMLIVFGFIFQQGYSRDTLLISSRLLYTTTLIFSIIIYQFYSSYIVASLLVETPKTIKTIQHLLDSEIVCYIDEIAYIRDHIEHYNEESVIKIYNKIKATPNATVPLEVGVDLIKKGGNAFYTDGNHGYQALEGILSDQEKCDLQEVKYVQKVPGGPGVPKKSPIKELMKISLRRISETGLLAYHWKTWIGEKPKCTTNSVDVVPVDVAHFSSALYVHLVGMYISIGILIAEMFINRYFDRKACIE